MYYKRITQTLVMGFDKFANCEIKKRERVRPHARPQNSETPLLTTFNNIER